MTKSGNCNNPQQRFDRAGGRGHKLLAQTARVKPESEGPSRVAIGWILGPPPTPKKFWGGGSDPQNRKFRFWGSILTQFEDPKINKNGAPIATSEVEIWPLKPQNLPYEKICGRFKKFVGVKKFVGDWKNLWASEKFVGDWEKKWAIEKKKVGDWEKKNGLV